MATRTGAAKPADFSKVIVDTTVQLQGGRLFRPTRSSCVSSPRAPGEAGEEDQRVGLRQSY